MLLQLQLQLDNSVCHRCRSYSLHICMPMAYAVGNKSVSVAPAYSATTLNESDSNEPEETDITLNSNARQSFTNPWNGTMRSYQFQIFSVWQLTSLWMSNIFQTCSSRDSALWTHGFSLCPRWGKNLHPASDHVNISIKNANRSSCGSEGFALTVVHTRSEHSSPYSSLY